MFISFFKESVLDGLFFQLLLEEKISNEVLFQVESVEKESPEVIVVNVVQKTNFVDPFKLEIQSGMS